VGEVTEVGEAAPLRHLRDGQVGALEQRGRSQAAVLDVLTRVIGPDVKMMQSMLFIKSEGKPGQAWHRAGLGPDRRTPR